MKRLAGFAAFALLLLPLFPSGAEAADFRSNQAVTVAANEVVNDDLYAAGSEVRILGTVKGDVFATASTVIIDGVVEGSLNAGGTTVIVNGRVDGSARVAGATVSIGARIGRDLLAAGATVTVDSNAKIAGDALFSAAAMTMGGTVQRDLRGSGSEITINGTVGRNVDLYDTTAVTIGNEASIAGTLTYRGMQDANIGGGARIGTNPGRIPTQQPAPAPEQTVWTMIWAALSYIWGIIRTFLGLAVLGLLALWVFPRATERVAATITRMPVASGGIGLLALLLAPMALLILLVLWFVFGLAQLMVIAGAVLALGLALAGTLVGFVMGGYLLRQVFSQPEPRAWAAMLVGTAVLAVLVSLPVIGFLFLMAAVFFGFGAVLIAAYSGLRGHPLPPARTLEQGLSPAARPV